MSQLTTVRTASRTAGSTQWWHLTFTTGGFDVADGIIEELVTPLVAQARSLGAKRWYFSRSGDPAAPVSRVPLQPFFKPRCSARRAAPS